MTDDRAVRLALTVAKVTAERDELEAAVDRVRRLHGQYSELGLADGSWCPGCGYPVPCPTIKALNGEPR